MLHIVGQYLRNSAETDHRALVDQNNTLTYAAALDESEHIAFELVKRKLFNNLYHELIYRTGDIVHYNEHGEIIYDGRRDSQIKHSGHRIELGEIETAVFSSPDIRSNCCLHDAVKDQLILFYVGDIGEDKLRKYLNTLIPEYMLPNVYYKLDTMPLNMNGKIDRVKLRETIGG